MVLEKHIKAFSSLLFCFLDDVAEPVQIYLGLLRSLEVKYITNMSEIVVLSVEVRELVIYISGAI